MIYLILIVQLGWCSSSIQSVDSINTTAQNFIIKEDKKWVLLSANLKTIVPSCNNTLIAKWATKDLGLTTNSRLNNVMVYCIESKKERWKVRVPVIKR